MQTKFSFFHLFLALCLMAGGGFFQASATPVGVAQPASAEPSVLSIVRGGASPTNAQKVEFIVTFSEPVTGVDIGDFAPVISGVGYVLVTDVCGSGSVYIVSVFTGYGDGWLGLDLVDNDTIHGGSGEALGGNGMYNGNFSGTEAYIIER